MIPVEKIDTTVALWEYLYKVRIPYMRSRHIQDIKLHGTVLSGIREIDSDINNQMITTMMNIADMAEHFKQLIPIYVCHHDDVKQIYDSISKHIYVWKQRLERGINIGDAPIQDLILLDHFANNVYEHAKYHFTSDEADNLLTQHLNGVQRVNAHNFFSSKVWTSFVNDKNVKSEEGITRINAEEQIPDRDSLGEFFKTRLIGLTKR